MPQNDSRPKNASYDSASIPFGHNPLNRMGHQRTSDKWVAQQRENPQALFVPFLGEQPLILPPLPKEDTRDVAWLSHKQCAGLDIAGAIFLGINRNDKPLFACACPTNKASALQELGDFADVRELAMRGDLPAAEFGILAQAKAMLHWHETHSFCARCGAETKIREGGYKRVCSKCSAEHFPRTDPVVIMLATYKDQCLLGRQKLWPANMFSALAGFVEAGETIEAAVARELDEEAGVSVQNVRYVASQPWPFPASLMIGCLADATSQDITLDGIELEDAKWFAKADIAKALAGEPAPLGIPPAMAIAHHLLRAWTT